MSANGMMRRWARGLAPLSLLQQRNRREFIWRGVYPTLRDVPMSRAEFGTELIDEMASKTAAALATIAEGGTPLLWHQSFALVAGAMASRLGRLRVLDFGGATGSGYVQLLSSLPRGVRIDYLVVDSPEMCRAGCRLFDSDPQIRFADSLPAAGSVDLVYANAVLPYIDDYAGTLRELASLGAEQIFLARLAAGSGPTFASCQVNVPGRVFPYWFLNFKEVTALLAAEGYRLACDSFVDRVYDQRNLPATHRVERFRDVLFAGGQL